MPRTHHAAACVALLLSSLAVAQSKPDTPREPPALDALAPVLLKEGAAARDVSDTLAKIIAESKTPGMVAAVVTSQGGPRIVASGAAGVRAAGHSAKVTIDDQFHIGSCTKAMTATLCAMLVEDGTLRFDLTLAEAFPELAGSMNPAYKAATLADLVRHRAGIPSDLNASGLWGKIWSHPGPPLKSRTDLLPEVLKLKPIGKPGESFLYSNAGYAIAGHICERATKTPFEQLIRDRLWKPLGMTSAGFNVPGIGDDEDTVSQPRGHNPAGKPMLPTERPGPDNPQSSSPAGTVHMTVSDWAKFAALHLAGARGEAGLLLKPESFKSLHALPNANDGPGKDYAMGWVITPRQWADEGKSADVLTHSGSNTMWFAVVWIAPKRDLAVLVCTNSGDKATTQAADKACWALIQEQIKATPPASPSK
jgi:CubicO group peptidase (beta-lactamase class C family)